MVTERKIQDYFKIEDGELQRRYYDDDIEDKGIIELGGLVLDDSKFRRIADGVFDNMPGSTAIGLRNNEIEELPEKLLARLKHLKVFDVSRNWIEHIPPELFENCNHLVKVKFTDNRVEEIPSALFKNNQKLKYVDFAGNEIREIPPDLFEEVRLLSSVNFSSNNIETIDEHTFVGNKELSSINLAANRIDLDRLRLQTIAMMTILDLRGNRVSDGELRSPVVVEEESNTHRIAVLNALDLSWCGIKKLGKDAFRDLRLSHLYLANNELETIPEKLFMGGLNVLDLNNNMLREIPKFETKSDLTMRLEKLKLNDNKIEKVESGVLQPELGMRGIELMGNEITEFDNRIFDDLPKLRGLRIEKEKVEELGIDPPEKVAVIHERGSVRREPKNRTSTRREKI